MPQSHIKKDFQNAHLSPPHANLGGSGQRNDRAADHFAWEALLNQASVNDNKQRSVLSKVSVASLVFAAFICGAILGMSSSAVATQTVLQADDRMLVMAMDVSPDMLSYALNAMDVGETE